MRSALRAAVLGGAVAATVAATAVADDDAAFAALARSAGTPQIPGLTIVYLTPLGDPAKAPWRNIIVHQTEGPPNTARALAIAQKANPTKRGVTIWVETDGTVYWATDETAVTTHGDGANRNDNRYLDNTRTYRQVLASNSIGVEFVGNFPDVRKPATAQQERAWLILVRFLQERYAIPFDRIYAHNWIDYKDARYCEGCDLAAKARAQGYVPLKLRSAAAPDVPLPRERPAPPPKDASAPDLRAAAASPAEPSACAQALAAVAAYAPQPAIEGPGECAATDVVRLEAVLLPDGGQVAVSPAATLRCSLAAAVAHWVRDELAPAAAQLGSRLAAIENYDSYACRSRNRVAGARLSEHGRANALDIRALRLADGRRIEPAAVAAPSAFRAAIRASACARFTTVLGPGSDGYHEQHIHVDLAMRRNGYRMCRWQLHEAEVAAVPLPRPRAPLPK